MSSKDSQEDFTDRFMGIVINKNQRGKAEFEGCAVHFIPIEDLQSSFHLLDQWIANGIY